MLIHPPFNGKFNGKPLGLVHIATALRNRGHEVVIYDLNAKRILDTDFKKLIKDGSSDYVGIASTSPTHLDACHLGTLVKQVADIPVIKGGTHETYCYQTTLERHPEIDISVRGVGEETIVELIEALEKQSDLSKVTGIAYRDGKNVIVTPERLLRKKLDEYSHPDRTLLEPSTFYDFDIFGGAKTTQVRMSRGCSYGCNFCPIDRTYKFHSADYVMEELRTIAEEGYKAIFWDDAIFTANRRLVSEVLEKLIAEGLTFQMGAQTRADIHITPEMLRLMSNAGFTYLSFGMESGDQAILSKYNKMLNVSEVEKAVKIAKDAGMRTSVTAIIGAPEETLESVGRTVDVINRIRPDSISWSVYSVYPGSSLEFDPTWYEDPSLSREDFWKQFDEGYKAKHIRDIEYVQKAWELVREKLNPEIDV